MKSINIEYLWSVMPSLPSPILLGFWTFTFGLYGNAGVRGNMTPTYRYSQSGASSANWGPKNTAVIVSSVGKSTFGFDRSRLSGLSALRMFREMAITFSSHLQEAHQR
jgi:hypothetical protein